MVIDIFLSFPRVWEGQNGDIFYGGLSSDAPQALRGDIAELRESYPVHLADASPSKTMKLIRLVTERCGQHQVPSLLMATQVVHREAPSLENHLLEASGQR